VNATPGQTVALGNLYGLVGALPPRYRSRASFLGDLQILNRIRQFELGTGGSNAGVWVDSIAAGTPGAEGRAGTLLGKPVYEASEMPDTPATGLKFLIFGDFSRYVIVDRIGLSIEVLPHLLGANRRPTGERGLFAFWRNGAKVIDANAFRTLLGIA
jgi:HK97 family phage major capsid protein